MRLKKVIDTFEFSADKEVPIRRLGCKTDVFIRADGDIHLGFA
jgi:hypothetical protein